MIASLKMLARDWRGGELGVLLAALVIAVAVVSGISSFASRLQNSLEQESHRFLAADRVVSSGRALSEEYRLEAERRELNDALTLSFPSMIYAGEDDMVLVSVKAVSDAYPLRGDLVVSAEPFSDPQVAEDPVSPGEVWLDSRLFPLLNVQRGDLVSIGDAEFTVGSALRSEPDSASGFSGYGPRVLMHYSDIPATGVVQPGSRVEFRLLVAGEPDRVDDYAEWLETQLKTGERILDLSGSQRGIGSALERAERFLLLAGSLGVMLAGVAIALAARRFSERHYDYVAIMKSLGATTARVNRLYGSSLLLLGGVGTALGCGLGWLLQASFFGLFADELPVQPGSAGAQPWVLGACTALICLFSFAWPPLARLGKASPLRVLRRDLPHEVRNAAVDYSLGLAAVVVLMLWYSRDLLLTGAVLAGLASCAILAGGAALLLLRGGRLAGMRAGSIWRLALAGLQRRGESNALQVAIFSIAILLLLILVLVRTSLIDEWQMQIPEGTPNHFLLNIAPDEVNTVREALTRKAVLAQPLYPMIRGRLTEINGEALGVGEGVDDDRRERESNLTWSADLPLGNELVDGAWWDPATTEALVSVEQEFAQRLGLEVGDQVRYMIGSQPLDATVSSIRTLDWESMQPNFFMVFPAAVLQGYPATFMTSFHLEAKDKRFLNEFIRSFPTVTVIEMDMVIAQVRSIIDRVSAAIELVLVVILAAGALVLIAGVQASVDARLQEAAILRTLGAGRGLLLGSLVIEFSTLGLFAGLLATMGAEISVAILQVMVLDMTYRPSPLLWFVGPAVGVVLIGALGVWNCRKVVSVPPLAVLRDL